VTAVGTGLETGFETGLETGVVDVKLLLEGISRLTTALLEAGTEEFSITRINS
jgi:hypothetical protein